MRNNENSLDPAILYQDSIGITGYYQNDYIPVPPDWFNAPDLDVVKIVGNEAPELARESILTLPGVRVEETQSRLVYSAYPVQPPVPINAWNGQTLMYPSVLEVATQAIIPPVPMNRQGQVYTQDIMMGNVEPDSTSYRIADLPIDGACIS